MAEFNNYFNGQFIESSDLNFDNESHRNELAQRFNLLVDTPGVVQGYKDSLGIIPGSVANTISLLPGIAFDINGKIIEVLEEDGTRINIPFDNIVGQIYFVKAKYKELLLEPAFDPITGVGPDPDNPEIPYFTKVKDYYEISISTLIPDQDEVEIGRVIGSGAGNLVTSNLIDLTQRPLATIDNNLLVNIDHSTLKNIGTLTHNQLEQRINQLFADTGIIASPDGTPSLGLPLSELIGNIFDHNHSGDGQGARIDHNSLINIHPDQHHKKIHKHSLDPGQADPDSDDAFVEKINLSDDGVEPIEVRGKLSGANIKDLTIQDNHVSQQAEINQTKIAKSGIVEDNFLGIPQNLQHELNQIRSEIKFAKFGHDPLKKFYDPQTPNIKSLDEFITTKFNGTTGHKHSGSNGDGAKLDDSSIVPGSLTAQSIAEETITNILVSPTAAIDESKINLEDSYAWRNFVISGAGLSTFNAGDFNVVQPLVIYDSACDRKVNVITLTPLSLNPGDAIFVEWPENHDDNNPLILQSSNNSQVTITNRTIILGYVNDNDTKLYANWAHNPFHRHTGTAGDGERLDINDSTTGNLSASRLSGTISLSQIPNNIDATKIANGSVSNTEFQYLDGLNGSVQGQLDDKVTRSGDTMAGDLIFPNNKKILFQSSTTPSAISLFRPSLSPSTKARLNLALGDNTTNTTLSEFQIGRMNGTSFDGQITLSVDQSSGKGLIESSGKIKTLDRLEGNDLLVTTGKILGTNNYRMFETSNSELIINPVNDFTDGTRVVNKLLVEGLLPADAAQIWIENQIIEEDNSGGTTFSKLSGSTQVPTFVTAKDFYALDLDSNTPLGTFISQLQATSYIFKKEIFTSAGLNTETLSSTPVADSVTVYVNTTIMHEGSGHDYTISGNSIVFNPGSIPSNGDSIFVQYAYLA